MSVLELVRALASGRSSAAVAKDTELTPMRELYIGTGGTFKAWLRSDNLTGASTDFGTVGNNTRFPYDVKKIDNASGASGFVAIR